MSRLTYNESRMEEYARRTTIYADYMISEMQQGKSVSVRGVAKAFKDHPCRDLAKSHVTIYKSLVEVLPNVDIIKYVTIKNILDQNKAKSIEDNRIRARILTALNLFMNDFTINEIVEYMNKSLPEDSKVTFDIIYRDLTVRLKRLDDIEDIEDIVKQVAQKMTEHKEANLNNKSL